MHARRLGWAGVELTIPGLRLVIDPLKDVEPLKKMLGDPLWPIFEVPEWDGSTMTHALVTHRHPDHFDPTALRRILGPKGIVHCPAEIVDEVEAEGLIARGMAPWQRAHPPGPNCVAITAVPAVDWRGDHQVSWIIESDGARVFHGGDTIWHGSWWAIAERFPRFDAVFLPVNGVIVTMEGMEPSNLPATLTPDQAAVAARLLRADVFCPIHYGQFNRADTYREWPAIEPALRTAAGREGVSLHIARDGEVVLTGSGSRSEGA